MTNIELEMMNKLNLANMDLRSKSLEEHIMSLEKQISDLTYTIKQLSANVQEIIKKDDEDMPTGDYLNPIRYVQGMAITVGLWYFLEDKDLPHEAIASGIPNDFYDTGYFDYIE